MTIAEKRANEYYPKLNEQDDVAAWHGFIAGYEQARKDMMKDAVEATVMATKCGDKYQQLLITDWNNSSEMCNGQKVRIVVLKAEEE